MNKIIVTADSTCDLSAELLERYQIKICPLHVVFGEEDYLDGVSITPRMIYEKKEAGEGLPKTAAINMQEYIDFFTPFVEEGYDVFHVGLGSGLSSTFHNCELAAEELGGKVHPVDSGSLSTGSGLMALAICDMIAEGKSVEEIEARLPWIKANCHASFVIDTLEYLYKGGRCSALAMLGASVLQIKPSIEVNTEDGSMNVAKKYRGNIEKALLQYVRDKLVGRTDIDTKRIFVTYSPIDQEIVDAVVAEIPKYMQFDEILCTDAGCTVSSHCGPGCLGILFMTKE